MSGVRISLGRVVDDTDPKRQGRVQVVCPQFLSEPFWARPIFDVGTPWAIPNVGDTVVIESPRPGDYRWRGIAPGAQAEPPDWADTEYPARRALVAKQAPTLVGLDGDGNIRLGHFAATEPAALGTTLVTKLASALDAIEDALSAIRSAAYGSNTMDPGSQAAVLAAITTVQTVRQTIDEALSEVVFVARDQES